MDQLRKKHVFLVNLFFFFIVSLTFGQQDKLAKVDTYIQKAMQDWNMPGFSVSIVKNDSVIFAKGYGIKETGKDRLVDENTLFVIASCSKAFTTASLSILVDQGKIRWDDPITKYLPDFQMYDPWVTKEITIRDLVTHKSGLATFSGDFLWLGSNYNTKEIIKRARYLKSTSSFRSKYGYQNIMFITAAEIINAVTDTSWADFLKTHILKPLAMRNTNTSYFDLVNTENAAKAHFEQGGVIKVYKEIQTDNAHGAIGINSSAKDMAQWIRLQLAKGKFQTSRIFSERQSAEMWTNQTVVGNNNYGLGWMMSYRNGKRIINHGGGMPGMISDVTLIPEENFGFVLLSNLEVGMVASVRQYIIDIFTDVEPKDYEKMMLDGFARRKDAYANEYKHREELRVKDSKPSLPLAKYCGSYEDKMYGQAEVRLKDEKLFLQFIPTPTFRGELKHWHYDTFSIDWEDEFLTRGWIKFDMDFNGDVKKFTLEVPNSPDFIFTELSFEKMK
jgi:CubicO group peptidase (beta-lactamase class C family)